MKKIKFFLILILITASMAFANVDTTDINPQTTQPNMRLVTLLRDKFDAVNLDIAAVTGLYNIGTGDTYYVDSGVGSDSYAGTRPEWAVATVDAVNSLVTANNGDVVYILQNHGQNLSAADAIDCDVAGVTYVCLGEGTDAPQFTYTQAAGELVIGAANILWVGGRFEPSTPSVTMGISVEAAGDNFTIIGAQFPEPSTAADCFLDAIDLASGADGFSAYFCTYRHASTDGPNHFIEAGNGVNKDMTIVGCDIAGEFSVSAIWSDTADWWTTITDNKIVNLTTGQHCIEFTGAAEGVITRNTCYGDTEGSIIDPGSMFEFNNLKSTAINTPALPDWVIAQDLNHLMETATADTSDPVDMSAEVPDNTILANILDDGGDTSAYDRRSHSLVALAADATNSGTYLIVQASVTSSNIASNTQASSAITGAASGTLLLIEISINTDGTGLAGPTNFEFSVDNTYGDTGADDPIAVEAAGGLGASTSWVCSDDATSHQLPVQIESGSTIYLHGDDSAGTGAGNAQITMIFQRVTDAATIAGNDGPS